jgi:HD-like signal output (HDOD) protein
MRDLPQTSDSDQSRSEPRSRAAAPADADSFAQPRLAVPWPAARSGASLQPSGLAQPIDLAEIAMAARDLGALGGATGAARLLKFVLDENVDAAAMIDCIRAEPMLAARVLRIANSAYYRRGGSVASVERAIVVLGLSAIRGIAAACSMDRMPIASVIDARRFRQHSLAVALATQALSARAVAGVATECFVAGLLHDVGVVVIARLRTAAMAQFVRQLPLTDAAALSEEIRLFGMDHATASARLADAWRLPGWMSAAFAAHHLPPATSVSGIDALPALLALGNRCADDAGFGLLPRQGDGADAQWLLSLGLDVQDRTDVTASLADAVNTLSPQ